MGRTMAYSSEDIGRAKAEYLSLPSLRDGRPPTPGQLHRHLAKNWPGSPPSLSTLNNWMAEHMWVDAWIKTRAAEHGEGRERTEHEVFWDDEAQTYREKTTTTKPPVDYNALFAERYAEEVASMGDLDSESAKSSVLAELGAVRASAGLLSRAVIPELLSRIVEDPTSVTTAELIRIAQLASTQHNQAATAMQKMIDRMADDLRSRQGMMLEFMRLLGVTPQRLQQLVQMRQAGKLTSVEQGMAVLEGQIEDVIEAKALSDLDTRIMGAANKRRQALEEDD